MTKFGSALPKRQREPQRFETKDPNPRVPFSDAEPPLPSAWVLANIVIVAVVVGLVVYLNCVGVFK